MEEHPEALSIVKKLVENGFLAYYAGGWVRDFLLQYPSDDIDIATSAPPETIQNFFRHTVPVGIAFGIIIVVIGQRQYEVATFRRDLEYKDGRRPSKIEFTSAWQDAMRRDFTINGMFYDPIKKEVLDFVQGKEDLAKKIIRTIGNPHERIKEDRLRMIRAIRLSCRFGFEVEEKTMNAIRAHANELFPSVAIERIVQELQKMAGFPNFKKALLLLHETGLLRTIFPDLKIIPLKEMEKRLHAIDDFPTKTPLSIYLMELFGSISLDRKFEICKYLKLSRQQLRFVLFQTQSEQLLQRKAEKIEWAYFYADPHSRLYLFIHAARLPLEERKLFLEQHEQKKKSLSSAIERIENHDPIIKSEYLKKQGIDPSPLMGKLLREAERIAINEKLRQPEEILAKLKKSPLWPKS